MSKSYKKYHCIKQEKADKRDWNRKVRRSKDLFQGAQYKKFRSNWCNWKYRWTIEDAKEQYFSDVEYYSKKYPTVKDYINLYWKRICYRK